VIIPRPLVAACSRSRERQRWLERLPALLATLAHRWSVSVRSNEPFDASAAWVAPGVMPDGTPVVLKIPMPHMEAADESEGLRFWAGNPTVALLDADPASGAMVLERCLPGVSLRSVAEPDQDAVIAGLLRRLWREPSHPGAFRPLSVLVTHWCDETVSESSRWPDPVLVTRGLRVLEELTASTAEAVLLATDLHAGNVLSAEREPWLVIDPKPFVGDPAFDATQHLLNCRGRLRTDMHGTIARFARALDVDARRVAGWLFARLAAEPRDWWDHESLRLARSIGQVV
jgi:streptomycin 6-kinase